MLNIEKVSPGDPIRADDWNSLVDAANGISGVPPLRDGLGVEPDRIWIGKALTGGIGPRSGLTPGAGNVRIYTYDGSAMEDTGVDVGVLNFSGASSGVEADAWCSIGRDGHGRWWLISAECTAE